MKLLVVLVLVFLTVCHAFKGKSCNQNYDEGDNKDDYASKNDKKPECHHYTVYSYLGHKIHAIFGKGTIIVHKVIISLYKKLIPLLSGHLFKLYHDADDFKDDVKNNLQSYTYDDGSKLADQVDYKVEELKKIAAYHIKVVDIKGLKAHILFKIKSLKVYLIKSLVHLKAKKIYHIKLLKLKLLKAVAVFKKKLLCLTHKIDTDVVKKIKEAKSDSQSSDKQSKVLHLVKQFVKY